MSKVNSISSRMNLSHIDRASLLRQDVAELLKAWAPVPEKKEVTVTVKKRYDWAAHAQRLLATAEHKVAKAIKTRKIQEAGKRTFKLSGAISQFEARIRARKDKALQGLVKAVQVFSVAQAKIVSLVKEVRTSETMEAIKKAIVAKASIIAAKKRAARAYLKAIKPIDTTADYVVVWSC